MKTLLLTLATVALGSSALAAQGRVEISPHDLSPSSPTYTITEPGSYVLSGVLTQHDPDASVILVQAQDVTIDLAGFGIVGSGASATGSGEGISSGQFNTYVHSGFVRGVAGAGVFLTSGVVRDVRVRDVGGTGIAATLVRDCLVDDAVGWGIKAATVLDSRVMGVTPFDPAIVPAGIKAGRWVRGCEVDVTDAHAVETGGATLFVSHSFLRSKATSIETFAVVFAGATSKLAMTSTAYFVDGSLAPASGDWTPSFYDAGDNMKVPNGN